ncbi:MAG: DNA primase [Treponema sp.]|nr:DNA primase [Treponema sp.]
MARFISKATIQEVIQKTDIVDVIKEYCSLQPRGADWWGCCPFHNEKTASFSVSSEKKFYYCFGCHKGGDVIKFLMDYNKISYSEAILELAKRSNIPVVYDGGAGDSPVVDKSYEEKEQYIELYTRVANMFNYLLLNTPAGRPALKYILDRGLSHETIKKFNLGWSPNDAFWLHSFLQKKGYSSEFLAKSGLFSRKNPNYSVYVDRFMFPIQNRKGQTVALGGRLLNKRSDRDPKYINSPELPWYKKGEIPFAFDIAKDAIRKSKEVIICEGYMDAIAYHQCGFSNTVASLGTAFTEEQLKLLKPFVETVLLSFDSDNAGKEATLKAILMCRRQDVTVKIIQLTQGKDSAEIMLNFGKETLSSDVKNAILDNDYLLSELLRKYPKDSPEGKARAASAFFSYLDALQSDVQKSSCLEQLCRVFNLDPEAARKDYLNRKNHSSNEINQTQYSQRPDFENEKAGLELRALFVLMSDLNKFLAVKEDLTEDDFEDPQAKSLFVVLRECCDSDDFSFDNILSHCSGEVQQLLVKWTASGEYSKNAAQAVDECMMLLERKSLERKQRLLMEQINNFRVITASDNDKLRTLLEEKMNLDRLILSTKG